MSKKYFLMMQSDFRTAYNRINVTKNTDVEFQNKVVIRTLHIVKAFCRNMPLEAVECGNWNDGNFKKALIGSIKYMKEYASRQDFESYMDWVSYSTFGHTDLTFINKKHVINVATV